MTKPDIEDFVFALIKRVLKMPRVEATLLEHFGNDGRTLKVFRDGRQFELTIRDTTRTKTGP